MTILSQLLKEVKEFLSGDVATLVIQLRTEVLKMSQAIDDRFTQLNSTIEAEKAEVTAELQKLRDEIEAGRLNEADMIARLDQTIDRVQGINTPTTQPGPGPVEPVPDPANPIPAEGIRGAGLAGKR